MRPKILLCEDEENVADNLADKLSTEYGVTVARTYADSTAILRVNRGQEATDEHFSVVIIDLSFETTSGAVGIEGLSILEEAIKDPFIEPIIFTGTGTEVKANEASKRGAFRFIRKGSPADNKESVGILLESVRTAIECRNSMIAIDTCIKRIRTEHPDDHKILTHLMTVFEHLQRIRGRRKPGMS